jgi:hypothetical protein
MKHGDKAKSKAASKASGKKSSKAGASSKAAGAKSSKAIHAVQKHQASSKTAKQTPKQTPAGKSHAAGDNGKAYLRLSPDELTFSNPVVSAAFKRAVKKYANAFRKLTD